MALIEYIRTGRQNAVTREELVRLTGKSDRINRREIERLRNAGVPIMSSTECSGYWMAESVEEVERFLREAKARIRSQSYPKMARMVAEATGKRQVIVREHVRTIGGGEVEGQVIL